MGYAARESAQARAAAAALAAAEAVALAGLKVVLDVQHIYRQGAHAGDRGARFTLSGGMHVWEAAGTVAYAAAAAAWLKSRGATVFTNDPSHGVLVGPYSRRHKAANALGVHAYLACHINAGGGSYAAAEYMVGTPGQPLGTAIGTALTHSFREIRAMKCVPMVHGGRGAVCVEAVDRHIPAIVLEPFFGDNVRQQAIFEPHYLAALGVAIGHGIAAWWQDTKGSASGAAPASR